MTIDTAGRDNTPSASGLKTTNADPTLVESIVTATLTANTTIALPQSISHLVAEYDHTYDVARTCPDGWIFASTVPTFAGRTGHPSAAERHQLQRIRLFGADPEHSTVELVITATATGFRGRWTTHDHAEDAAAPTWLQSRRRTYLLADTPTTARLRVDGFTRFEYSSGQFIVVPADFGDTATPLGHTHEFFAADPDTGAVHVAAVMWTGYTSGADHTHERSPR